MPVARRAIDGHAVLSQALAGRVNVFDGIGQMAKVAAAAVTLGIPVVGELDLGELIARSGQEHQRISSLRIVAARELVKAERVSIEAQRLLDVGHADHCMQILHGKLSRTGYRDLDANLEQSMHKSKLSGFIIDCRTDDLEAAAAFWSRALGMPIHE